LAPFSSAYLTESKAATILWLLVIFPSLIGTLKSTLNLDEKSENKNRFSREKYKPHQHALALQIDIFDGQFI
jgi:hypothetical protein